MNKPGVIDRSAAACGLVREARRDSSLDIARGLIVALMALDHVRMFFSSAQFDPTDLDRTNLGYFAARWVTHLCAPGFFFIAGLSAGLFEGRAGRAAASKFLLTRGLLLIALEIVVFGVAWSFNPGWWWFGVIAGLGASMVALSGLIWLPRPLLFAAGALFTLLHNSLWGAVAPSSATLNAFLYSVDIAQLPGAGPRIVLYPLLPWLALMTIGYAAMPFLKRTDARSAKRLLLAASVMVAGFVALRFAGFGEPAKEGFDRTASGARAFMSFMNLEKYPPSLQYSLVTLGIVLGFLALVRLARMNASSSLSARVLETYGRVPFFFYLVHLFLIHGSALAIASALGWPTGYLFWSGYEPNLIPPNGYGLPLAGVIVAWIAVLAILYPLCRWYGELKASRPSWLLKLL